MTWNCQDTTRCLAEDRLSELGPEERQAVSQHLEACQACRAQVDEERALDEVLTSFLRPAAAAANASSDQEPVEALADWRGANLRAALAPHAENDVGKRARRKRKLVLACCAVLLLVAAAWGVQKVARKHFAVGEVVTEKRTLTSPDGSEYSFSVGIGSSVASDDPEFTKEKAEHQYQEALDLVRQGKAKLTVMEWDHGRKLYKYRVVLSNGEEMNLGGLWPLDTEMTQEQRVKEWADLIAQGKVELVEVEELEDGKKKYWYRLTFSDGLVHTFEVDTPFKVAQ